MDDTMEKAIKYISNILKDTPDVNKLQLVEDTSKMYNLNPLQTEFLTNKIVMGS
jgi:mannitol/fructose-specific phosphotransferase system IIA component (Ntr-type)